LACDNWTKLSRSILCPTFLWLRLKVSILSLF
jgi:hypothetical protein